MMIHMCIFLLLFMVVGAPLLPSLSLSLTLIPLTFL